MKGARGFTLLEMLIALTIFGLGTALLLQSTWSGVWAAQQGWAETSALRLAQSVAAAGGALPSQGGTSALASDPAIDSLPYRIRRDRLVEAGGVAYRVEVRTKADQTLATVITRSVSESQP
ncbi:type II secretion system protein [Nitrospirillum iridis]|uniref:Prepilin-type N-terminal cleavage/methylation domain-containing protein n=1 Tax=Nitrospirillum iridis TaxID=765888 RepID=A0A7X0B083_9PROT|nr:prepilin-type N-terminal cleavage/methylation domain-containing protein [Nitrospirillum iridis]MBB6253384.1 prepilin-type N-terminal cleavage/methylation domain-containing protein [Nitrospirillum iridis]